MSGRASALDEQQVRQRAFGALRPCWSGSAVGLRDLVHRRLAVGRRRQRRGRYSRCSGRPRPPRCSSSARIGATRPKASPFLRAWKELQRKHDIRFDDREVKVAPLTARGMHRAGHRACWARTPRHPQSGGRVQPETGGNPYLLIELVGCFDPQTDSFRPMPLHRCSTEARQLPTEAGPLLDVVAVSGQALRWRRPGRPATPWPRSRRSAGCGPNACCRWSGRDDDPLVDTYHDKIRETILGHMDEPTRKGFTSGWRRPSRQAMGGASRREEVAAIERGQDPGRIQIDPARVYDLAYHCDAAGDTPKARAYALLAAEQARRQSALEVAVNHYETASETSMRPARPCVAISRRGYGESLMLLGRYEDAAKECLAGASTWSRPPRRNRTSRPCKASSR